MSLGGWPGPAPLLHGAQQIGVWWHDEERPVQSIQIHAQLEKRWPLKVTLSAFRALRDAIFREWDGESIWVSVHTREASILLTLLGFQCMACLPRFHVVDGVVCDMKLYRLLRGESHVEASL